ncbi:hypothetical protein LguiB_004647 [Lonicera macranthoides]
MAGHSIEFIVIINASFNNLSKSSSSLGQSESWAYKKQRNNKYIGIHDGGGSPAAKEYIENYYKSQMKCLQDRKERSD